MRSRAKKREGHGSGRSAAQRGGASGGEDDSQKRRALWRGSLGFGLIQIPAALVTAESPSELAFHELDKRDSARIGYERVNKSTGKPVEWKDIVKGYEIEKGRFVVLEPDDFAKANVAATQSIDVLDFVRLMDIPPLYYERPYYIVPEKGGQKAYAVLRDALASKGYAAIATVVLRTRQHLCAVIPQGNGLVLELLRFAHELRPMAKGADGPSKATSKEIALAEQLIDGMKSAWDPKRYRDSYSDDLLAAIRQKDKTGRVEPVGTAVARPANVMNLADLLQQSLAATKKRGRTAKARKAA
ncbi:MAG: Ku protein [Myxococcota bacterium]|nr:Ku protein [Myxococcota bacterium]